MSTELKEFEPREPHWLVFQNNNVLGIREFYVNGDGTVHISEELIKTLMIEDDWSEVTVFDE